MNNRIHNLTGNELGKIPPQAIDLEEAVLGGALLMGDGMRNVINILKPADFYLTAHKKIFQAMVDLFDKGEPIDMLTVTHNLKAQDELEGVGGAFYIAQLSRRVASASNIEAHCYIIKQQSLRRQVIELSMTASQDGYDETKDVFSLIDSVSVELINLREGFAAERNIKDVSLENIKKIGDVRSGKILRYGLPTMLSDMDNIINGLIAPDLIILAARPGMGKTGMAMTIIKNIAIQQKKPVGMFSLEMSIEQLEIRLKSMLSGVPASKAMRGNINDHDFERLKDATHIISNAPLYINDKSTLTVTEMRSKVIEWKANHNIELLVVDYIQLIHSAADKNKTRNDEVGFISSSLKRMAKELNIPVLALSQLNRSVESQKPPEPKLSHLRESGSIEQDADIVMMLYRPAYYKIPEVSIKGEMVNTDGLCIVNVEKHRNGATGSFPLSVHLPTIQFSDYVANYNPDQFIETVAPDGDLIF
jgi:replicative DNA helicase